VRTIKNGLGIFWIFAPTILSPLCFFPTIPLQREKAVFSNGLTRLKKTTPDKIPFADFYVTAT
jgi:hypothetical protein